MLMLTRKEGQKILIGDNITILVHNVDRRGHVTIGIDAPKSLRIDREEVRIARTQATLEDKTDGIATTETRFVDETSANGAG